LQRAIEITPKSFLEMWSKNDAKRRISNPALVERISNDWQKHLGSNSNVEIAEVFIDKLHLQYLDMDSKQLQAMGDRDLVKLDIQNLVAGRAIVKLKATGFDSEISPSLAVHLSEKGEQFSYGNLITVCSNFTILRSDYFFDTQKAVSKLQNGKKWEMKDVLKYFNDNILPNTNYNFDKDMAMIEDMKTQTVARHDFTRFIGDLFTRIEFINHHRVNRSISQIDDKLKKLPINGRQLGQIVVEAQQPAHRVYDWQNDTTTAWNIVNFGTEILKFQHGSDSNTLLEANSNWIEAIKNFKFQLS
jgi:hypothetical protein